MSVSNLSSAPLPKIETRPQPRCVLCGGDAALLYPALSDRTPGVVETATWTFVRCRACGFIWLNPQPCAEHVGLAYRGAYYTHAVHEPPSGLVRRLYYAVERGYLAYAFGYTSTQVRAWQVLMGRALAWYPMRRAVMDLRAMHLTAESRGHLLEIGCGNGRNLVTLQELGWGVEGVEGE